MRDTEFETLPDPTDDLLAASPETAYFWGHVAGNGGSNDGGVTVHAGDERVAGVLGAIADADDTDHRVAAHRSAHDASVVRYEDEYELTVADGTATRASRALGFPTDGDASSYRFEVFSEYRAPLVRGLLEACGTVCFRESSSSVGVSFVHADERLLGTVQSLLSAADPQAPCNDLQASSSGGYWFGLADGADVAALTAWLYDGTDASGLYSAERRRKLRRSVERATGEDLGGLGA